MTAPMDNFAPFPLLYMLVGGTNIENWKLKN
jgi:hypothetical protein